MNELFFDEQCLFTQYRNIQTLGSKIINSNDLSVSGNHPAFIKNYSKDKKAIIYAKSVKEMATKYRKQLTICKKNLDKNKYIIF